MITCPTCNSKNDDGTKFCPRCGTNLQNLMLCPVCGGTLDNDAKFCVHCGSKLDAESVEKAIAKKKHDDAVKKEEEEKERIRKEKEIEQARLASVNTRIEERKKQKENEMAQKKKAVAIVIPIIILVLGFLGYMVFYVSQSSPSSTSTKDNVEEIAVDEAVSKEASKTESQKEAYVGDGATFEVRGKVKKIETLNNNDNNYYTLSEFDKNCHYITEYPQADRDSKGRINRISTDNGDSEYEYAADGKLSIMTDNLICSLDELDLHHHESIKYNYQYDSNGNICSADIVIKFTYSIYEVEITNPKSFNRKLKYEILQTDSHGNWTKRRIKGTLVDISDEGFEIAGENDHAEDEEGYAMYYKDIDVDFVETRRITYYENGSDNQSGSSKKSSSKEVAKSDYPSWIADKWHISTREGFYSFNIRKDKTAVLQVNRGMHEGSPEEGSWEYSKESPYCKVTLYFSSQTIKLLVDEKRKIIATENGYDLYSSSHPERNQYANPVKKYSCHQCGGSGQMRQYAGNQVIGSITCPNCGGSGKTYK